MSTRSDEARAEPDGDVLAALDLNRLRDGSRRSLDPANQALFDEIWNLRQPGLTVETLAALIERSEHAWRNDDNTTEPRNVYVAKAILNTRK